MHPTDSMPGGRLCPLFTSCTPRKGPHGALRQPLAGACRLPLIAVSKTKVHCTAKLPAKLISDLKASSTHRGENPKLGPHEVGVRVTAVGLNFRDVLNVLGMYPGDPGDPGGDCAGIVTAAGSNSQHR